MHSKIKSIKSPLLLNLNLKHGFFQGYGGVSSGDFESLNVKKGMGDPEANIQENLKHAAESIKLNSGKIVFIRHSFEDNILVIDGESSGGDYDGYDAVMTNRKNTILGQGIADCGNLIVSDKNKTFVGLVHGSWHTTKLNIVSKFVSKALSIYKVKPENILISFGPMLCFECFEFGEEASDLFERRYLKSIEHGKYHFNNKQNIIDQLIKAGVDHHNIWDSNICTLESEDYFSYRRSKKQNRVSGRFLNLVSLN